MTARKPFGPMVIATSTKHSTAADGQRDEFLACWSDPHPGVPADEADDATLAFHGDLDRLLAATRAEAVAPVLDVLRQLVEAMPRCTAGACGDAACEGCDVMCGRTATRGIVCDEHGEGEPDSDYAAPLRAALALLAADQAGEKAGKP